MKNAFVLIAALCSTLSLGSREVEPQFDTKWVPEKPEVLTYRVKGPHGEGMYQLSLARKDSVIECSVIVVTSGYSKVVRGMMGLDMRPLQSSARIAIHEQILMDTQCSYSSDHLRVTTTMTPYHRTVQADTALTGPVLDFWQSPVVVRAASHREGRTWSSTMLDPQKNRLIPFKLEVLGRENIHGVECTKIQVEDFDGKWIYWVETEGNHRVIRAQEPNKEVEMELEK